MWKQPKFSSMDEWAKQKVAYTYNGILFSLKHGNSGTCYNMHESEDIMLSEISHSQKDKYWMNAESKASREVKSRETESKMSSRACERKKWEVII